ncbi:MAG TPA: response regulator [Aggregatilineaceae bacterium]|nr:response regulator [Aggregatilineaceae bacterium]
MDYRVVLVEDETAIVELLGIVLAHPHIELHAAYNGLDGLALIRRVKPDLVMLDVMLPGMDGWEVYDAIRVTPSLVQTPVIMISVVPERPERRQAFLRSEIDLYVTKPFDALRLRRAIAHMLGGEELWGPPSPEVLDVFEKSELPAASKPNKRPAQGPPGVAADAPEREA